MSSKEQLSINDVSRPDGQPSPGEQLKEDWVEIRFSDGFGVRLVDLNKGEIASFRKRVEEKMEKNGTTDRD